MSLMHTPSPNTDEARPNPDKLLEAIQKEDEARHRGHLKIFFGYAAGVGKTFAMLQAAQKAKKRGVDCVIGYVEPHARPATTRLTRGLEQIPLLSTTYNNITLHEMNLDAIIARKPQLVLVDELAHTNAPGSRHDKRYRDVLELLEAGIDVYTTINVQHIESLNDIVASITNVVVHERIPDKVFDAADQVELVDIEPQDLLERLNAGEVYQEEQAKRAQQNFFTTENLTALREIALRRCADRMNLLSIDARAKTGRSYYTGEHVLVCISAAPSTAKNIRAAARMAHAFNADFSALYVETPKTKEISEQDQKQLKANMDLAERLGAHIETSFGDDIAFQISEFARLCGVSKIVLGRSSAIHNPFGQTPLTEQLLSLMPNYEIHIIPDSQKTLNAKTPRHPRFDFHDHTKQVAISLILLSLSTIIGMCFDNMQLGDANIITVYLFGDLLIAILTASRLLSLTSSIASVLLFNYFFVAPRYSLFYINSTYAFTFAIMFVASLLISTLAARIVKYARESARTAYRTRILLDTSSQLQKAQGVNEVVRICSIQIAKLVKRDCVFYPEKDGILDDPIYASWEDEAPHKDVLTDNERAVATWTFKNNKHAGATTATLPRSRCLYLAVHNADTVYGVVGIEISNAEALSPIDNSLVMSILSECALALESEKANKEREEAAILMKSEQLRANLLRSISHDLRTPLTSISGAAGVLLSSYASLDDAKRTELLTNIYDDSRWLINLVENLLSVTRLEDGVMRLTTNAEVIDDIINDALHHLPRDSHQHCITTHLSDDILLAKMDAHLIEQVIINLVDNAIKYTEPGSHIDISTYKQKDNIVVEIADDGQGIPDHVKPYIFDMFFIAHGDKPIDSRRSLGLGLSLCRSIISAHNGTISIHNNHPHGACFRFTLPAEEIDLHE